MKSYFYECNPYVTFTTSNNVGYIAIAPFIKVNVN